MALSKKKTNKKTSGKKNKSIPKSIKTHYIKTNNYRSYHADGVFGGLTPNRKIYMEFFIQRAVTPKIIEYKVTEVGDIGDEIKREGKKGIVREIEAGVIMDIDVAKVLRNWLDQKIKLLEELETRTKK